MPYSLLDKPAVAPGPTFVTPSKLPEHTRCKGWLAVVFYLRKHVFGDENRHIVENRKIECVTWSNDCRNSLTILL